METEKAGEAFLRHVETDVLIPKMMREKAKERCAENVMSFNHCCKDNGFMMVFRSREQNAALKEWLTIHYKDPVFFEECKQEYTEKLEFQRTGVAAKNNQKLPTSMYTYRRYVPSPGLCRPICEGTSSPSLP
ncbi:LOW QUALITY PROTEIN: COX assembly mitochondrial protein homolog [Aplochiton taeniatus]